MLALPDKTAVCVAVCLAIVGMGVIYAPYSRLSAHLFLQTGDLLTKDHVVGSVTARSSPSRRSAFPGRLVSHSKMEGRARCDR